MGTAEENPTVAHPVQVIEYASPDTRPLNPDEPMALLLGFLGAILFALSVTTILFSRQPGLGPVMNLLGLISGGVGWGLSRHSRPNASHRLCAWVNALNWIGFVGIIIFIITRI